MVHAGNVDPQQDAYLVLLARFGTILSCVVTLAPANMVWICYATKGESIKDSTVTLKQKLAFTGQFLMLYCSAMMWTFYGYVTDAPDIFRLSLWQSMAFAFYMFVLSYYIQRNDMLREHEKRMRGGIVDSNGYYGSCISEQTSPENTGQEDAALEGGAFMPSDNNGWRHTDARRRTGLDLANSTGLGNDGTNNSGVPTTVDDDCTNSVSCNPATASDEALAAAPFSAAAAATAAGAAGSSASGSYGSSEEREHLFRSEEHQATDSTACTTASQSKESCSYENGAEASPAPIQDFRSRWQFLFGKENVFGKRTWLSSPISKLAGGYTSEDVRSHKPIYFGPHQIQKDGHFAQRHPMSPLDDDAKQPRLNFKRVVKNLSGVPFLNVVAFWITLVFCFVVLWSSSAEEAAQQLLLLEAAAVKNMKHETVVKDGEQQGAAAGESQRALGAVSPQSNLQERAFHVPKDGASTAKATAPLPPPTTVNIITTDEKSKEAITKELLSKENGGQLVKKDHGDGVTVVSVQGSESKTDGTAGATTGNSNNNNAPIVTTTSTAPAVDDNKEASSVLDQKQVVTTVTMPNNLAKTIDKIAATDADAKVEATSSDATKNADGTVLASVKPEEVPAASAQTVQQTESNVGTPASTTSPKPEEAKGKFVDLLKTNPPTAGAGAKSAVENKAVAKTTTAAVMQEIKKNDPADVSGSKPAEGTNTSTTIAATSAEQPGQAKKDEIVVTKTTVNSASKDVVVAATKEAIAKDAGTKVDGAATSGGNISAGGNSGDASSAKSNTNGVSADEHKDGTSDDNKDGKKKESISKKSIDMIVDPESRKSVINAIPNIVVTSREQIYSYLGIIFTVFIMIPSTMQAMEVLETSDLNRFASPLLTLTGFFSGCLWSEYALKIHSIAFFVPNLIGVVCQGVQMSVLFFVYTKETNRLERERLERQKMAEFEKSCGGKSWTDHPPMPTKTPLRGMTSEDHGEDPLQF